MKRSLYFVIFLIFCSMTAQAQPLEAPTPPEDALELMPVEQDSFSEDIWYVIRSALGELEPELATGGRLCLSIIGVLMLTSILSCFPGSVDRVTDLCGGISVAILLLGNTGAMIDSATETIQKLSDYSKLLLPVITAAMAAQGGITSSAALYAGTAIFDGVLCSIISGAMIPLVYIFIILSVGKCVIGEGLLDKLQSVMKWLVTWCLKTILYVFTGYMAITGVVSGSTDQTALKATKLTISGMVPVVGGILSDASEAVLVSAGTVKNAVGVYGLIAIIAIAASPFLRIGVQHLLLKLTSAVCGIFGSKRTVGLIEDLSAAMGLLLAMTGAVCVMLLISVVCFMKGVA